MMTYVSLITWTDQGIRDFRDTTHRAEEFAKLVEGHPQPRGLTGD